MFEDSDAQRRRIIELETELADARLEIEGIRKRSKCVTALSRERCEQIAARISKIDMDAADLIMTVPFYVDNAATWRGIAAAMGYEPLAHQNARPIGKWLNERVAMFRKGAAKVAGGTGVT